MIWIGAGEPSDSSISGVEANLAPSARRLAGDWAVAMPSRGVSSLHLPFTHSRIKSS